MARSKDALAERADETGGWTRPRVVVSACLELEACRFNGNRVRARFIPRLASEVELIPICPEVEIGLGVPRPAIRLVSIGGETRLIQPETSRDITEAMSEFAEPFLDGIGEVDGFLLKSRSPSCGHKGVKVYNEDGNPVNEKAAGHFAAAVADRFPRAAIEDEGRLTNYRLRHHFLTRLFQTARLRALPARMSDLVRFHASSKTLLLAYSETTMRRGGRIIANRERFPPSEVKRLYVEEFAGALASPPKPGPTVNTLMHAFGHVSDGLVPAEKDVFLEMLDHYRGRRATLEAPLALLRGWTARFGVEWLTDQSFFHPYPDTLHDLADSAGETRAA